MTDKMGFSGGFIYIPLVLAPVTFLTLNFYGLMYDPDWQKVMVFNWIYNLSLLSGFAAGERLAFHKTKIIRKSFSIKYVKILLIGSIVAVLASEGIRQYNRRNTVSEPMEMPVLDGYLFSGSQTMMEYFMGDLPLKEPLQTEYIGGMDDLFLETANYQNHDSAIGYSFRYFATIMINDMDYSEHIKYLSVDDVSPDAETIRSGEYPITTELLYTVTLDDNPNENVEWFLKWMTGPQGQQIVADTGYVAIRNP